MKKWMKWIALASFVVFVLAACGKKDDTAAGKGKLKVVTSFTIIEDMAREIGGADVEIHNLVPTGTDPHEYEPLPKDTKAATDADILFYNGLNLEGGKKGWFYKMIDSVGQKKENIFKLTDRVKPMYLQTEGEEGEINPHAFIDPAVGIKMAEDMTKAFVKKDPDKKANYEKRGNAYVELLKEIDKQYAEKINDIPKDKRMLVTSERAFQYMTAHYGLKEAFIWEIDTEENGSPSQIKNLVQFVHKHKVPVLFIESNVDRRPMETVSKETGVSFSKKPIYSDEIGKPGEAVDTYIKYLNYNIKLIHDELSK